MQIVFLGTSGSWPTPGRNVSAVAMKRGPEIVLFDCGEGTQRQFMLSKLSFMQVTRVFISHYHGDHFLGLPGMIQTMSMNGRENGLFVYGPEGIKDLVRQLLTLGYFAPGFAVNVEEMKGGYVVNCGDYSVSCISARHTVPALSFCLQERDRPGRFDLQRARELGIPAGPLYSRLQAGESVTYGGRTFTPDMVLGTPRRGRKIVYTGDTLPNDDLIEFARDCDVIIHDATADTALEEKANRYGHSTARQAAEIAKEAGAKVLFLTHISPRYEDPSAILHDAKAVFDNSFIAEDFMEFEVRYSD